MTSYYRLISCICVKSTYNYYCLATKVQKIQFIISKNVIEQLDQCLLQEKFEIRFFWQNNFGRYFELKQKCFVKIKNLLEYHLLRCDSLVRRKTVFKVHLTIIIERNLTTKVIQFQCPTLLPRYNLRHFQRNVQETENIFLWAQLF